MTCTLTILQHALGVDEFGQGRAYRDHFVAGPGHSDFDTCMEAVKSGLMLHFTNKNVVGGHIFIVTNLGRKYVATESPAPPKTTRSQRRYRAFLDHDSGLTFKEWLQAYGEHVK